LLRFSAESWKAKLGPVNALGVDTHRTDEKVMKREKKRRKARWWFQTFSIFTPKLGEDSHFDDHIVQRG